MDKVQRMRILAARDTSLAVFLAQDVAKQAGLRPIKVAALATAVSELTTNIIKYAGNGLVTVQVVEKRYRKGVEVLVQDRGPGIADIEQAMKDHVSTSGTLGLGLPGTRRMVDEFELQSQPGEGTQVRIVVWA
jgi:serine/threonine-protein kinase RsbT